MARAHETFRELTLLNNESTRGKRLMRAAIHSVTLIARRARAQIRASRATCGIALPLQLWQALRIKSRTGTRTHAEPAAGQEQAALRDLSRALRRPRKAPRPADRAAHSTRPEGRAAPRLRPRPHAAQQHVPKGLAGAARGGSRSRRLADHHDRPLAVADVIRRS